MKAEQFIYGLFKGYGVKLIKSAGINELLNSEIISYLCQLADARQLHSNLWPNGVITVTKVHTTQDEFGRDGVWNHTIVFRLVDYLEFMQPSEILKSYFVDGLDKPPRCLEPLKVTKK